MFICENCDKEYASKSGLKNHITKVCSRGMIYLVQPAELLETDRYKIGCSSKNNLDRIKSYKKGTRYIHISECNEPYKLEDKKRI
jgi:hypothetical protein